MAAKAAGGPFAFDRSAWKCPTIPRTAFRLLRNSTFTLSSDCTMTDTTVTTVLYLESDELTRRTVSRRLGRSGFQVRSANSIDAALTILESLSCVPVIVLDLQLPGTTGENAVRRFQSRQPAAPLIVFGCDLTDERLSTLESLSVSPRYCLCKPCPFDTLVSAIREVGGRIREDDASAEPNSTAKPPAPETTTPVVQQTERPA